MTFLTKVTVITLLVILVIGIPTALCYGVYLLLVKLGAAKWIAAAIAITIWAVMGISANNKKY